MVALTVTILMIIAGMVLDFGLVRVDRQIDRSASDAAALAGTHALNVGDGSPHPFIGVCTALRFLRSNSDQFNNLSSTTGTWATGTGTSAANGCDTSTAAGIAARSQTCTPGSPSTWAVFTWSGTYNGKKLQVTIQSGYQITATSGWSEDTLPAATAFQDDSANGCDQLAVSIQQARHPGLGSLATNSDLVTAVRSVARLKVVAGDTAPAMLLLRQTGCPVLDGGSASGGSFIHVLGAVSDDNVLAQPGTIHSDSDGNSCSGGSNQNIYLGTGADGIVAYAAPLLANHSQPDPSKPGLITSLATQNGKASNYVYDSLNNVYGSSALSSGGTKSAVVGRALITRKPIDSRYHPNNTGVVTAISNATSVFANASTTYTYKFPPAVNACSPSQTDVDNLALPPTSSLYIDCAGKFVGSGDLVIPAERVYFRGWVNPGGKLQMPNADHVYVENSGNKKDGILLNGSGSTFQVNNKAGNLTSGICSNGQSSSKSELFVRTGDINESNGSTLQLCRTTVFLMGGSSTGCVPSSSGGVNPAVSPCPGINSGLGTGQFTQTGGNIDWTAPDQYDATVDSNGNALPALATPGQGWTDPDGPEDLALWAESGTDSSNTFNMNGGGTFHVRGVFMVPNADPFRLAGSAAMNLTNAQFVASSIKLSGTGTKITMGVDPYAAVTLPDLQIVGLVR